jgi:DNA-binding MarR family transcriptional regulator
MDTVSAARTRRKRPVSGRRSASRTEPRWDNSATTDLALGILDSLVGFHLRLAQEASFRGFSRRVGEAELRPGRFAAMMIIRNNPGVNPAALSRAIGRDKSSVTPLLQKLEKLGLVDRAPQAEDARSHGLTLTAAGERPLDALLEQALAHDRQLDEIVGAGKADLIAALKRIARDMR